MQLKSNASQEYRKTLWFSRKFGRKSWT